MLSIVKDFVTFVNNFVFKRTHEVWVVSVELV